MVRNSKGPTSILSSFEQTRVRNNIEAVLDNKTYARHWIYWFYDTIKHREETFLQGAQRRWSLGKF